MLADLADTLGHIQGKYRPQKLEVRVDSLDAFAAAIEAKFGPMVTDASATGSAFAGIPIIADTLVSRGMAVVIQDGFVVDVIRYAPKEEA